HRGQGTLAVEIVQPQFPLTVRIEINGLPDGCPRFASETAPVSHIFSNGGTKTDCPTMSVVEPQGISNVRESIEFRLNPEISKMGGLQVVWAVSSGSIEKRQGTT